MSSAVCSARARWRCSDSSVCSAVATVAGGQVVQLDAAAVAAQRAAHPEHVHRQGLRAAGVVGGELAATGLVVDDHELAVALVDAVDPPRQRQSLGAGGHRALDPDRFVGRVGVLGEVVAHPARGGGAGLLGLPAVAEAEVLPVPLDQCRALVRGPVGARAAATTGAGPGARWRPACCAPTAGHAAAPAGRHR